MKNIKNTIIKVILLVIIIVLIYIFSYDIGYFIDNFLWSHSEKLPDYLDIIMIIIYFNFFYAFWKRNKKIEIWNELKENQKIELLNRIKKSIKIQIILFFTIITVFYLLKLQHQEIDIESSVTVQEIQSFNDIWKRYDGKQTGTDVIEMINKLITNYSTYVDAEVSKQPILYYITNEPIIDLSNYKTAHKINEFKLAMNDFKENNLYYVNIVESESTAFVHYIIVSSNKKTTDELTSVIIKMNRKNNN